MRSSDGCWTCKLRRKKCDERHPVCEACTALAIACHYGRDRPEWMDGGVRQEEMAAQLKREIKDRSHHRKHSPAHALGGLKTGQSPLAALAPISGLLNDDHNNPSGTWHPVTEPEAGQLPSTSPPTSARVTEGEPALFSPPDTFLFMFYLDNLLPFLFPFYRPSLFLGGRGWLLEMMIKSPVVRQATLCQSSFFFSLARGTARCDIAWDAVLQQTQDAFTVLRQSLEFIDGSVLADHIHGAVRIMASIMQVQRFEIATLSFDNCQAHLNAALTLFRQLLETADAAGPEETHSSFDDIIRRLAPSQCRLPTSCMRIPSAEESAFRFSSSLLILDDIIASTVLQEEPRLHHYHHHLLASQNGRDPAIDLECVVGCQNWVLLQISEIASLDAWKQRCKRAGTLDVIQLVHRATAIKYTLGAHLEQLQKRPSGQKSERSGVLDMFTLDACEQRSPTCQKSLATCVWAHAALLYLSLVVSGWQPASAEVRYHVDQVMELLTHQISPPALLRTMTWPFCVAGCLAGPAQQPSLRQMAEDLQPQSVFGTVRKALEIMENVWRSDNAEEAANRDLAACFRSQGNLVLLV